MSNHEEKNYADSLDVYMALSRTKDKQKTRCLRVVAKNPEMDLAVLKMRVKLMGGKWRIHKTVNKRDTEKARKWLLKKLIDFPEGRGFVDSLWRTALLQPENVFGEKRFMFDVDTKDSEILEKIRKEMGQNIIEQVETENGWHVITKPFDVRPVMAISPTDVELLRDGYVYIETVYDDDVMEDIV